MRTLVTLFAFTACAACAGDPFGGQGAPDADPAAPDADPAAPDAGSQQGDAAAPGPLAPELGTGDHGPASVDLVAVSASGDLFEPMDLDFDPLTGNLWVVNQGDQSWTIYPPGGSALRFHDDSHHFLRYPAALALIRDGQRALATCQESLNGGDLFMGPVAWTSDLALFEGGTNSHYDMLHESPYCMGIAWGHDRVFWVFNGFDGVIDRVDFHGWHPDAPGGLGGEDHTDGEYFRYPAATVQRVEGVHSGLEVGDGWLYVADTGNGRLVRLPAADATGPEIDSRFGEVPIHSVSAAFETVVAPGLLEQPSGLALRGGLIYVSDAATGVLHAFTPSGDRVNWLDTGLGAGRAGALTFTSEGRVLFLDKSGNRILRIDPR